MSETVRRATPCPDPADLAAFVDQKLTGEARAAMVAHLANCDDCREIYADAVRLAPRPRVLSFPRIIKYGGGALALAASFLIIARVQPEWLRVGTPTPYEELVAAVGTNRTVEGRLTGGFRHGRLRSPTRSGTSTTADFALLTVVAKIEESAQGNPDAGVMHALGVGHLVLGDFDVAVRTLEEAVAHEPGSARFRSDLAAAYFARGRHFDNPDDLARALQSVDRAIQLEAGLPEAHFNRALVMQAMRREESEREAWLKYLEVDPSSEWADEARGRLRRIG